MPITFGPKLGLPVNGTQGQEHYEELMAMWRALDALIQLSVISHTTGSPPGTPSDGDCYIVGPDATGDWSGQSGNVARYSTLLSAWEFYVPNNGWIAYSNELAAHLKFQASAWSPLLDSAGPVEEAPSWESAYYGGVLTDSNKVLNHGSYTSPPPRAVGFPVTSGKRYIEFESVAAVSPISLVTFGLCGPGFRSTLIDNSSWVGYWSMSSADNAFYYNEVGVYQSNTGPDELDTFTDSDRIAFAIDIENGLLWVMKNGVALNGDPVAGTGGISVDSGATWYPWASLGAENISATIYPDAATQTYLAPTGFTPWYGV